MDTPLDKLIADHIGNHTFLEGADVRAAMLDAYDLGRESGLDAAAGAF